jgi:hypothetical protein
METQGTQEVRIEKRISTTLRGSASWGTRALADHGDMMPQLQQVVRKLEHPDQATGFFLEAGVVPIGHIRNVIETSSNI